MVELNEKAVALAPSLERFGLDAVDLDMLARGDMLGSTGAKVFNALVALSAIPAPDDGLVERLNGITVMAVKANFHVLGARPIDTANAAIREAATALQSKDEQIVRLTQERDEALDRHSSAVMGEVEATQRAEAAEQQVQKLTAENERLREALWAADYLIWGTNW